MHIADALFMRTYGSLLSAMALLFGASSAWAMTAEDIEVTMHPGDSIQTIRVIQDEFDTEGRHWRLAEVGKAERGIVVKRPDQNSVVYFPMEDGGGSDQFSYQICSGEENCLTGTIRILTPGTGSDAAPEDIRRVSELKPDSLEAPAADSDGTVDSIPTAVAEFGDSAQEDQPEPITPTPMEPAQVVSKTPETIFQEEPPVFSKRPDLPSLESRMDAPPAVLHAEPDSTVQLKPAAMPAKRRMPQLSPIPAAEPTADIAQEIQPEQASPDTRIAPVSAGSDLGMDEVKRLLEANARALKSLRLSRDRENELWRERDELKHRLKQLRG